MFTWTDENLALLKMMWEAGDSATQIAKHMGTTKGSVLGKARRLGLPAREAPEALRKPAAPEAPAMVHTTREGWLLTFVDAARPKFEEVGAPLPEKVRVSIGFPSKGERSKVVGECWADFATPDKVCEIFIRPNMHSGPLEILGTLTHELMHAAVGHEAKHGPKFSKPLKALGMEGKAKSMGDGPGWREWAEPILAELGAYPGAQLTDIKIVGGGKAQKNRHVKLECNDCGFTCRTSKTQIEAHSLLVCPTECGGVLIREEQSDEGEE